ncbi:hypothetical protein RDI58_001090 [Solanum bulbocastanum]|uniref:Uncharacterized protein n=1 Tax=Solanum bulbocastanum TaxID=147425 RepID=A0AAN8UC37_SOLBU
MVYFKILIYKVSSEGVFTISSFRFSKSSDSKGIYQSWSLAFSTYMFFTTLLGDQMTMRIIQKLSITGNINYWARVQQQSGTEPQADPLQAAQTSVGKMIKHAYVDPNDPTEMFLQQPTPELQLRRRSYQSQPA